MDIDKLEGNSHKSKGEKTQSTKLKLYDIPVKTKKPSKVSKFAKSVIAEDAKSVGSYIVMDVLLPALRKLIVDIVENGITALVYGQNAPSKSKSGVQKVSYSSIYGSSSSRTRASELRNRAVYDMDDIIFGNYGEADMFLEDLKDVLSRERDSSLSVGDVRSSLKLPTTSTDWNYGWTDLGKAEIVRTKDGDYMIDFPRMVRLD